MSNEALENDITDFFLVWELKKYRLPRDDAFSKIAWQSFIHGVYLRIKGGCQMTIIWIPPNND